MGGSTLLFPGLSIIYINMLEREKIIYLKQNKNTNKTVDPYVGLQDNCVYSLSITSFISEIA